MRGLQSNAARQLALPIVDGRDGVDRMWESLPPVAQERILRLLARAIARVLSGEAQR